MKLNNYQKVLITWGILLVIGYSVSFNLLSNKSALLSIWALVGVFGLATQVWLGYAKDIKTVLIQLAWVGVVVFGVILTYLELRFGIKIGLHGMSSGWFFMCSGVMLLIALLYRFNISYLILFVLYAIVGLIIAFGGFVLQTELYISAAGFGLICLLDALLENTKLRS